MVIITCALRWGVTFLGISLLGVAHPIWETFQVHDRHRWTTLIQGHNCEESRIVALIIILYNILEQISLIYVSI